MTSTPMPSVQGESFLRTWIDALTKPREETYAAMGASPKAKAMTGYLWIFLTSIVTSAVTFLVQSTQITRQLEGSGMDLDQVGSMPGGIAVALLCSAPFAAVFAALFFAIWTALMQWVAKMFGGTGNNDKLAYTLAAISAPYSLVSAVFVALSAIPYVGFCFSAVLGLGGLYVLVLQVMAIKGTNRFGWGPAIGAYAIPGIAVLLVCCCAAALLASVMGLALGDVWSTINESMIGVQ
jgi:hypothetical protein